MQMEMRLETPEEELWTKVQDGLDRADTEVLIAYEKKWPMSTS